MMLEPLKQWICDTCGQVIKQESDGWLEWIGGDKDATFEGFKIVHHNSFSPRGGREGCYTYSNHRGRMDFHLRGFTGVEGSLRLLHMLDNGNKDKSCDVKNIREWAEIYRRLFVPYYEEARLYFPEAFRDDRERYCETNMFLPSTLREIIETYGETQEGQ